MTGRPSRRSTSAACAFMATSMVPPDAPNSANTMHRVTTSGTSAGRGRNAANSRAVTRVTGALPSRASSGPLVIIAVSAPTARQSSATPSTAGLRSSRFFSSGIWVAQTPKTVPF